MQLRSWCVWAFAAATACGGSSRGAGASSTDAGGDGSSGSASSSGPSGSSGSNGGSFSGASTSSGSSNGSSGGPSSSGTSGASTGSSSGGSGGASSSGTSSSGSGDGGSTTHLTPQQMVQAMMPGWNLGNTFDAQPNETSWGNPEPTQAMIQAVHAAGFNTHHDADLEWVLLTDPGTGTTSLSAANQAQVTAEVTAVWTQIADAFKSYGDQLIFECFNEPHGNVSPYSGGDAAEQAILNSYLAACVNAIRGTGGNNATRYVMIQPIGASPVQSAVNALVVPNDDPNILISLHTYYPVGFS